MVGVPEELTVRERAPRGELLRVRARKERDRLRGGGGGDALLRGADAHVGEAHALERGEQAAPLRVLLAQVGGAQAVELHCLFLHDMGRQGRWRGRSAALLRYASTLMGLFYWPVTASRDYFMRVAALGRRMRHYGASFLGIWRRLLEKANDRAMFSARFWAA